MDELGHGISMFCVINRRSKNLFPRQLSETLVGLTPSFNRARNGYAMNAVLRHRRDSPLFQKIIHKPPGCPPAAVRPDRFPPLAAQLIRDGSPPIPFIHGRVAPSPPCAGRAAA